MKIILSGGGKPEETLELDRFFLNLVKNGNVLFIPIAKTTRTPKECYEWVSNIFKNLNFKGKMKLLSNLKGMNYAKIKKFDAIYLGGGNTFHLLKEIKLANFDNVLKKYIYGKGIIYGISAGAVIFCKDIKYVKEIGDINNDNLVDTSALNILKDTYIWPHYNLIQDDRIGEMVDREKVNILGIPEGAGVYIVNEEVYVQAGEVFLFSKNKKYLFRKGEKIPQIQLNSIQ